MLCEVAENYFNSINPLAARISGDIRRIRLAYEDLWQKFSPAEQEQIINETIIHPQILLKYSLSVASLSSKGGCRFPCGTKQVVDDNSGTSWRDEYSAPFSWKGKSQLDLCQNKRCVAALPPSVPSTEVNEPSSDVSAGLARVDSSDTTDGPATTFGALSGFCSRLKILPGKSRDYPVSCAVGDGGILSKIKTNTVSKLQSTLRMVSGRVGSRQCGDGEMLVLGGSAVIVPKAQKPSPKKPTSPPPPPPPRIHLQKDLAETPLLSPNTPIENENENEKNGHGHPELQMNADEEEAQSLDSFDLPEAPSLFGSTRSGDSIVPKSGFDFLDNW